MSDFGALEVLESVVSSCQEVDENVQRLRRLGGLEGLLEKVVRVPAVAAGGTLTRHLANGHPEAEVRAKRDAFGPNTLPAKMLSSWFELFVDVFRDDQTVWILMGALQTTCRCTVGKVACLHITRLLFGGGGSRRTRMN